MDFRAVGKKAREHLIVSLEGGTEDTFLWEHARRVANNAYRISMLAEAKAESPDLLAVVAAALFYTVGRSVQTEEDPDPDGRLDLFSRPLSDERCEAAARIMDGSLKRVLPAGTRRRAVQAILSGSDAEIDSIEGRIVHDAECLEEFGLTHLWATIRTDALRGYAIEKFLRSWEQREAYQYWTAKLTGLFNFIPVQHVARRRLERFRKFIRALSAQHLGEDLIEVCELPDEKAVVTVELE